MQASGENIKRARTRPAPFRKTHYEKLLRAALLSRNEDGTATENPPLHDGDLYAILDGGRPGLQHHLLAGFGRTVRANRLLSVHYAEEALMARRSQLTLSGSAHSRGFMTVNQTENILLVTATEAARLGKRDNKIFPGTTAGTAFVNVGVPDMDNKLETWQLATETKRRLMGEARTAGSSLDGGEGADSGPAAVDSPAEPMNFESMVPAIWEEMIHRVSAKAVLNLTEADGVLATVCLEAGVPYLGISFGASHSEALLGRLAKVVFNKMADERCEDLYKPKLGNLLKVPDIRASGVEEKGESVE